MVRFVFGESGSGKTEYVISEAHRILNETDMRVLIIVPEQHTVSTEARIIEKLGNKTGLRLEVTNFTRLSEAATRRVGGISYTKLSGGARRLVLWRALISVWQSLTEFSCVDASETRLVPYIYSALGELARSGISSSGLDAAVERLLADGEESDVRLARKLSDLSVISAADESLRRDEFGEVSDPMDRFVEIAEQSGIFENTAVFIDSFYSLTGSERLAASEIIRLAPSCVFTVPMRDRHADGIHLAAVKRYFGDMLSAALRYADAPEFICLEGNHRARFRELAVVQEKLWDDEARLSEQAEGLPSNSDAVSVISVADRYEEAEALCAVISSFVRRGCAYSDIAVVCADVKRLRGIVDVALRRHGIPCFVSEPSRLASTPVVRLVFSLLRIPGFWRGEDVISLLKTGLMPVSNEDACRFESYCNVWSIRGREMFESEWNMNPDGYKEELTERGARTLGAAGRVRDSIVPLIAEFADTFVNSKASVRDICVAIVRFAENAGVRAAMAHRSEERVKLGLGGDDDAAREELAWSELCEVMDTMVDIIGSSKVDTSGFATLFGYAVSDAELGAIPTGADEVIFTDAAGLRTDGIPHIIMLGAVDGEFPASVQDDACFSDADREKLEELGLSIGSGIDERVSEGLFRFSRTLSQASETVTVFVPRSSAGELCRPSDGAMRILELTGKASPAEWRDINVTEKVYDRESLKQELRRGGGESQILAELYGDVYGEAYEKVAEPVRECIPPERAADVFGERMRLTQSRINTYVKCPFSYYCKYLLKLSDERKAEILPVDIGTFVHSVLEEFFSAVDTHNLPLPKAEKEALCDTIIDSYIKRTCIGASNGRMEYLFARLRRHVLIFVDAVSEELAQSRFEPYRVELPVGMSSADASPTPPSITFDMRDGGKVLLYGVVDRMDVYRRGGETFIRVVDYKTESKTYSYNDVKLGLDVQLLIYLFSLWRSGESEFGRELRGEGVLRPAGAFYLSVKPGETLCEEMLSDEEARALMLSRVTRTGPISDDRDVIDAMDSGITGRYTPVSLKADGEFKKCPSLTTLEDFGKLERELEETISEIAQHMKSGYAEAKPLRRGGMDPCEYCSAQAVCRRRFEKN